MKHMKMLTRTILFTAFLALLITPAFGQAGDTKVVTGVVNFQNGDYEAAMKALDEGLSDPAMVKPKNLPKGYYYRAKTRMGLMQQAATSGDKAKLEGMENAMFDVYSDYKKALETDAEGKWTTNVQNDLKVFKVSVTQASLVALNMVYKGEVKGEEKTAALNEVAKYCDMLVDMDAKDYLPLDIRGQAYMQLGDSAKSLADFEKAGEVYKANLPTTPDMEVGYTFYRSSVLLRYFKKDMNKAYSAIQNGKALLESEKARLAQSTLKEDMKAKKIEQYEGVRGDLRNVEMDLLLNYPEKRAEAIAEFKKAVSENPNDYIIHVAYANLLELEDQAKAVEMYLKAISIKPNEEIAVFNLGALYNNMAKAKIDQANETNDAVKADQFKQEGNDLLGKALAQFERAVELNPKSLAAVRAAKQVSITLNDMDKYKKYKELEQQLSAG